jgi:hypothetical protein
VRKSASTRSRVTLGMAVGSPVPDSYELGA